jgi:hypothetical protein
MGSNTRAGSSPAPGTMVRRTHFVRLCFDVAQHRSKHRERSRTAHHSPEPFDFAQGSSPFGILGAHSGCSRMHSKDGECNRTTSEQSERAEGHPPTPLRINVPVRLRPVTNFAD